jgi:hypothetical protein
MYLFDHYQIIIVVNANTIEYNGSVYSTLGDVLINGRDIKCQQNTISIPIGWELALSTPETRSLIANYTWSTSVVYVSDYTYGSLNMVGFGTLNAPYLSTSYSVSCYNNMCYVYNCYNPAQILIRQIPYCKLCCLALLSYLPLIL